MCCLGLDKDGYGTERGLDFEFFVLAFYIFVLYEFEHFGDAQVTEAGDEEQFFDGEFFYFVHEFREAIAFFSQIGGYDRFRNIGEDIQERLYLAFIQQRFNDPITRIPRPHGQRKDL